jgi:hypothetical protein
MAGAADIEYAAAYAPRTQSPGDQRIPASGGAERAAANDSPAPATNECPPRSEPISDLGIRLPERWLVSRRPTVSIARSSPVPGCSGTRARILGAIGEDRPGGGESYGDAQSAKVPRAEREGTPVRPNDALDDR